MPKPPPPDEDASGVPVPFATTLHVRDHCLCLFTQRAARTLARRFDEALRPLGLTNGQFSLMMSLNRPEPAAMGPVAALLGMDRTTLTAALKPLERRGLVARERDTVDRRRVRLSLTEAGRRLVAEQAEAVDALEARMIADLSPDQVATFREALNASRAALAD